MRKVCLCAAALGGGAILINSGCAHSLPPEWDDPLYQRVVGSGKFVQASASAGHGDADIAGAAATPATLPDELTADTAIRIGVQNHPDVRRAGYAVRAAAGRQLQAGLVPNPRLGVEFEALGADAGEGGETTFLVEQEILTAGKRRRAQSLAEADRLLEQTAFRASAFERATTIRIAYVTALAAEHRLEAFESLLTVADESLVAAVARVDAGAATEPDRLRAETVREQARIDAATARAQSIAARRALASAIGMESAMHSSLAGDLTDLPVLPDEEVAVALTLERNAEAIRAQLLIERAAKAHTLAQAEATPNLFLAAGPRYSDIENETTLDLGVGIELPVFDRNQGETAARLAERIGAAAALNTTRLRLIQRAADTWASYDAARVAVEAYGQSLLPRAERTLELERESYRAGKTDYLRLLDAQQALVQARIAHIDALQALHESAATLEGLMQRTTPWAETPGPALPETPQ